MAGIAGIAIPANHSVVEKMLKNISHRGKGNYKILSTGYGTIGIVSGNKSDSLIIDNKREKMVKDSAGNERLAKANITDDDLILTRDRIGVAPLYYGWNNEGKFCFASEIKALLEVTRNIKEFPPGQIFERGGFKTYYELKTNHPVSSSPENLAKELRNILSTAIRERTNGDSIGSWLSGGLDSSAIAVLANQHVKKLYTFSVGVPGSPDLKYAREVASHIKSDHHELEVNFNMMLEVLPNVIYHLESFDALLVRSSITNYLVAKVASEYVSEVFSGEGGDELFAGYEYLKSIPLIDLPNELIDIIGRLHNTALQRVDRSSAAFGTLAHVPFTDPNTIDFTLKIPVNFKIKDGVEKWILRQAVADLLPSNILNRTKLKFWEGAGVVDLLAQYADKNISDTDFHNERIISNNWKLNSKEELMYYRIFQEHFGDLDNLSWMGRTKGAEIN